MTMADGLHHLSTGRVIARLLLNAHIIHVDDAEGTEGQKRIILSSLELF